MRVSNFGALVILGSVASLLFSITANAALFPPGGPVRDLDAKDFDKTLQDGVRWDSRAGDFLRLIPNACSVKLLLLSLGSG